MSLKPLSSNRSARKPAAPGSPALGLAIATVLLASACAPGPDAPSPDDTDGLSLTATLGDQAGDDRFARITAPPSLSFPQDHGPHPAYRQEWWYFTGQLTTPAGRDFGYQVTFFRFALDRDAPDAEASRWHASQLYMAHLAVSDPDGERFRAEERFARGALDLAGARADPLAVWVEDWRLDGTANEPLQLTLDLAGDLAGVRLELDASRPIVRHGNHGYSQKGEAVDNASAYYSITRLATRGEIRIDGDAYPVAGTSWFDREWGTSFLAPGVQGWDWFSLHLDDGRDLMLYRLRDDSGNSTPFSGGTLVQSDARGGWTTARLEAAQIALTPLAWWQSPATGVRYPIAWRLEIPSQDMVLTVRAALDGQELDLAARYWEGAVTVRGLGSTGEIGGRGYLELAGY
jgi:predicted secreted hydrolase